MANCYLKMKNYHSALEYINNALTLIGGDLYGEKSKEYAFANVLKSKIHAESKDIVKGI